MSTLKSGCVGMFLSISIYLREHNNQQNDVTQLSAAYLEQSDVN